MQVSGAPQVQYTELARPEGSVKLPAKEEALVATRRSLPPLPFLPSSTNLPPTPPSICSTNGAPVCA